MFTRSSTDLYLYYFIMKCNLFIKILQRGKNTKNMKFVQNYKFHFQVLPTNFQVLATAGFPRAAEPWKFLRIYQIDINWKLQKHSRHQFILSEIFQKVWLGGRVILPPPPPLPRSGNRVNGKEIFKFKLVDKNVIFPSQLYLRGIPNGFSASEYREGSLIGNVYDFSVDYNSIDIFDILNIHKCLMT